jgi:hypothetical protein
MSRQRTIRFTWLCGALLGLLGTAGGATAGSFSTGFEASQGYTVGSINGQNGWQVTNPNFVQGVTNAAALSGTQSLFRSNNFASGTFGDQLYSPSFGFAGETGAVHVVGNNNYVSATVWFKAGSKTPDGSEVSVALSDVTGSRMWNVQLYNGGSGVTGGLDVLASDVFDSTFGQSANFVTVDLGLNLDPTSWHELTVNTQFVDGQANDVVQYFLDGMLVHTGTTWEQYYRDDPEQAGNGNQLFGVDRLLFRTAVSPSQLDPSFTDAGAKGFFFDNISVNAQDPAIPEPSTLALLGLGGAALAGWRRWKRKPLAP